MRPHSPTASSIGGQAPEDRKRLAEALSWAEEEGTQEPAKCFLRRNLFCFLHFKQEAYLNNKALDLNGKLSRIHFFESNLSESCSAVSKSLQPQGLYSW